MSFFTLLALRLAPCVRRHVPWQYMAQMASPIRSPVRNYERRQVMNDSAGVTNELARGTFTDEMLAEMRSLIGLELRTDACVNN